MTTKVKTTDKTDKHQTVTDNISQLLETGTIPWVQPWSKIRPQNVSGHVYSGMNMFLLTWVVTANNYPDPRFVTYNQAKSLGGYVKKGESGYPITIYTNYDKDVTGVDGSTKTEHKSYLGIRSVFNVSQCEGLKLPAMKEFHRIDPIDRAEELVSLMPNRPEIRFGTNICGYYPRLDIIEMACKELFTSSEHYYSTLFHELGHSTAHETRLDRKIENSFGSLDYSREELVAEMTAAMLMCECGLDSPEILNNNAAYIAGWLKAFKSDPKMLTYAAGQASKVAKYIIQKSYLAEGELADEELAA